MVWTEVEYSKRQVDWAGKILVNGHSAEEDLDKARGILNNWRSSHSFPLHIFKVRLKRVSEKVDPDAFVVQRLKRTPAIIKKLNRDHMKDMKLSRMQDIGGCRSVVENVRSVEKLSREYYGHGKHCDLKHEFKNKKDYINSPKADGYRSVHLIYKYKSDKSTKYNGLLVEVQIRSKLQHLWATAIETVDHFTKQALKSNEGEEEWLEFFRLVSTVFANQEKTPRVPGTPGDEVELYHRVRGLADSLQVLRKIEQWAEAVKFIDSVAGGIFTQKAYKHKPHYYLLELNLDTKELALSIFKRNEEEKATAEYAKVEKRVHEGKQNMDIVLVEADTTRELEKAYPNYFLDTKEFLSILRKYLGNPPKGAK